MLRLARDLKGYKLSARRSIGLRRSPAGNERNSLGIIDPASEILG